MTLPIAINATTKQHLPIADQEGKKECINISKKDKKEINDTIIRTIIDAIITTKVRHQIDKTIEAETAFFISKEVAPLTKDGIKIVQTTTILLLALKPLAVSHAWRVLVCKMAIVRLQQACRLAEDNYFHHPFC